MDEEERRGLEGGEKTEDGELCPREVLNKGSTETRSKWKQMPPPIQLYIVVLDHFLIWSKLPGILKMKKHQSQKQKLS